MVTEVVTIIIRERGSRATSRNIRNVGLASRSAAGSVRLLVVAIAAIGSVRAVKTLIGLSDTVTRLDNRIRTVVDSTEQLVAVQRALRKVSSETRAPLEETAALFQRFRIATRELGTTNREVIDLVAGLNAAILVTGANAAEARGGLLQLGQGLASGRLAGDELRGVLEGLPSLAQRLASELGVTTGELREMGRAGQLNAKTVFPALQRAVKKFRQELDDGTFVFTLSSSFVVLQNAVIEAVGAIQKVTNAVGFMNGPLDEVADNLRSGLVTATAALIDGFVRAVKLMSSVGTALNNVGLRFIKLGKVIAFLGKGFVSFFSAITLVVDTLSLSAAGLGGILTRLGSVVGIFDEADVAASDQRISAAFKQLGQSAIDFGVDTIDALKAMEDLFDLAGESGVNTDALDALARRAAEIANRVRTITFDDQGDDSSLDEAPILQNKFFQTLFKNVSADLQSAINDGFEAALLEGQNFFDAVGAGLEEASKKALVGSIKATTDELFIQMNDAIRKAAGTLDKVFMEVFGNLGPALSAALSGALQFVALQALSALFGGGGNEATTSTGNIESAVTSVQAVRGIVAGPQEIAIANVGQNIEEAFQPVLQELRIQTGIAEATLGAIQGAGSTFVALSSDTRALATGTAPAATS